MRRKSERKAKGSPEKKVEKVKRTTRTRRRKQSTSSDNESAEESTSTMGEEVVEPVEVKPLQTPVKEDSPEETQEQVWQVKTTEAADAGEIQKLKICLTRPTPSTPERADRSPRSKRKHSRATSSSDTPSVEAVEEKKKIKHRSKKSSRESKESSEKSIDGQEDKSEMELSKPDSPVKKHSAEEEADDTPMSTTGEKEITEKLQEDSSSQKAPVDPCVSETEAKAKTLDADTTVNSPKPDAISSQTDENTSSNQESSNDHKDEHQKEAESSTEKQSPSEDTAAQDGTTQDQVSKCVKDDNQVTEKKETTAKDNDVENNKNHVVESTEKVEEEMEKSTDLINTVVTKEVHNSKQFGRSESTQSSQDETFHNGHTPIVVNRKRRWGSRQNKVSTQKSITISTDVLKDIIPDVKPVEFDEVIEEKKHHRRIESERIERPVLPKIVIDNTENVENHKNEDDENESVKIRDTLGSNRKISIVKENDSIISIPPSPPRHKQSCVLFITNLVRPFTLPQLKNLLQRTGRIVENGFWIDRIKSKCFVIYETEDQAVETRHALHGVTWPVSNPKTLQVDFSTREALENTKTTEETDGAPVSALPGTVEDWLREQDQKRERGELDKPWERKGMREWDVGKNEKDMEKDKMRRDERPLEKRRHRTPERSPEPARKFKKKEEEAPAKLLDDLFRKTKTTPCIYWLPLSTETIAIKEEQRRQHMAEHERRMQEIRRHRRH